MTDVVLYVALGLLAVCTMTLFYVASVLADLARLLETRSDRAFVDAEITNRLEKIEGRLISILLAAQGERR